MNPLQRLPAFLTAALVALSLASLVLAGEVESPNITVPACPQTAKIEYSKSVPELAVFPKTAVDLCYSDSSIELTFTAYDEKYFYYNSSQETNGDIWEYEVMEAFLYRGTDDPQTYLELEVNPNNVTYQALVYNPSKTRADGAPFDHFFVLDPAADGFSAATELDVEGEVWTSRVSVPLGLFNIDAGKATGTEWRMNFFRTITNESLYPDQELGGWSPPDQPNFHVTPSFGRVTFV